MAAQATGGAGKLDEAIAKLKTPPEWFADQPVRYDMSQPWQKARQHVRQLLATYKNREAMKISVLYHQQGRGSKDGHEFPMYLFLGGEHVWAARVYQERLARRGKTYAWECGALASLYVKFGDHAQAIEVLEVGLDHLPDPPGRVFTQARLHDQIGDVYADQGDVERATVHYRKAMELFRVARPKYGRHLLPKRVSKVQAKLDLLGRKTLDLSGARDGVYRGESLGYGTPIRARVRVRGGRIAEVRLQHKEKIEQHATETVPRQIVERQSLDVDAVTAATITVQAVVEATYRALRRAGAK
ncbi:MAG: FMN-binding protein [Planctomycetota bacterium]